MYDFDFTGLFAFVVIGMIASVLVLLGGAAALIWFVIYHVQFV